jgi:osmotically-inducible protein OsmY
MLRNLLALITFTTVALPTGAQSPARGLRDQQIEEEIHARLSKSTIGKENFKVHVREGVAYWEGSTMVAQRKGAATRMAKAAGARSVVNNITVRTSTGKSNAKPGPKVGAKAGPGKTTSSATSGQSDPAPAPPSARRVQVQWGPRP